MNDRSFINPEHSQWLISSKEEMLELGQALALRCQAGEIIYLNGELGAGKTTLVRGFLRGLGYKDSIKSPTYTLVEVYPFNAFEVVHVDLYRISGTCEYENLGLSDYLKKDSILLIEWPEKAEHLLPPPQYRIKIEVKGEERVVRYQRDCIS